MKIFSLTTKLIYEITCTKTGENAMPCPECSNSRKSANKNKKAFSFNSIIMTGYCQHCNASFVEYKPYKTDKVYKIPEWKNLTELTNRALSWFTGRMISQATLNLMKIYSDNEYMPQLEKQTEVICFPYHFENKLKNIKYRGGNKSFKFFKDAELIFYNFDAVLQYEEIIIVEGEIDCLSYIEVGFKNCMSVPNGAGSTNLTYLENYYELFNGKKIIIATDNDIKGIELRNELLRRFGQERCKIVLFKDCKDANEYLVKYGGVALKETIINAFEVPVEGIIDIDKQYDEIYSLYLHGMTKGKTIGIPEIDEMISWETGRLATITGIPGHGKSEFLDYVLMLLNLLHGWKVAYFSPENYPVKYHFAKLSSKLCGKSFDSQNMSMPVFEKSFEYITDNYFFIYPEDDMSIENILIKCEYTIRKYGIKVLVVDPYNKLEHLRDKNESETEYISRFLDKLLMFAKRHDILICLVAHPRKMNKKGNVFEIPTLYDINGSANFYNKSDYGLTIYRYYGDKESVENRVEIHVQKVKFKHLGDGGMAEMKYNYVNGRFENMELPPDRWNYNNFISKEPQQAVINNEIEQNNNFDFEIKTPEF